MISHSSYQLPRSHHRLYRYNLGFAFRLPYPNEIQEMREDYEAKIALRRWSKQKQCEMLAYLNMLIYRAARTCEAVVRQRKQYKNKEGDTKQGYNGLNRDSLINMVKNGVKDISLTIQGACDLMKNLWGYAISEKKLRSYRYELRDEFRLFKFTPRPRPGEEDLRGDRNARRPNPIQDFDFLGALFMAETLEEMVVDHVDWDTGDCYPQEELVVKDGVEWSVDSYSVTIQDFPGCGYMPKLLYDTLFDGSSEYRRGERYGQGNNTEDWYEEWQEHQEEQIIEVLAEYGHEHLVSSSRSREQFFDKYWEGVHSNKFKTQPYGEQEEGEVIGRLWVTEQGVFANTGG
ncbi:MAG: hypothetical protein F6J86_07225 [Symploca sp. SIO1B1]|nr:hypothetical protein [Symploca sp. SIO1B1]